MRLSVLGVVLASFAALTTTSPPATGAAPLVISTTSLAPVYEGTAVAVSLKANGGGLIKTWHVVGGALPPGVALTSAGSLKGTPTGPGAFAFDVQVTSGAQSSAPQGLTWQVKAMEITTPGLGTVEVGQNFRPTTMKAAGGTKPLVWSVVAGSLPAGITMTTGGVITGTARTVGKSEFTLQARDAIGRIAQRVYQIEVLAMAFTTAGLPQAHRGQYYSASFTVVGGFGTRTFSVAAGVLPSGLKLSKGGVVSGVPTATSNAVVTFRVTDSAVPANETTHGYLMIVN